MSPDTELQRYLKNLPFKLKRELVTTIHAEAERLAGAIKAAAPAGDGTLRDSVKVRRKRHDLDLEVTAGGDATTREVRKGSGEDFDYAMAQEFGTVNMPARPFFYTTERAMRAEIRRNIERTIKDVLK